MRMSILAVLFTAGLCAAQPAALISGKVSSGALAAGSGEAVNFALVVDSGTLVVAAVDSIQGRVHATLRDPGGSLRSEVDAVSELTGGFLLAAVADEPGSWKVALSNSERATGAAYELRLLVFRKARSGDAAAVKITHDANEAVEKDSSGSNFNCDSAGESWCAVHAALVAGFVHERLGKSDLARLDFESAAARAGAAADEYGEAAALTNLTLTWSKLGDFRKGLEAAQKTLAPAGRVNSPYLIATAHSRYCGMLEQAGRMAEALVECNEAVRLGDASALPLVTAEAKVRVGEMLALQGDKAAETYMTEAAGLFREAKNPEGEAYALNVLAIHRYKTADFQGALEAASQVTPLLEKTNDAIGKSANLRIIGNIYARLGRPELADATYSKAAEISRAAHDRSGELASLNAQAISRSRTGDSEGSLKLFLDALDLARDLSVRPTEAELLYRIGREEIQQKQFDEGARRYRDALAIYREMKDVKEQAHMLGLLGGLARRDRNYGTALEYYRAGLDLSRSAGDRFQAAIAQRAIAAVLRSQGKLEDARNELNQAIAEIEAEREQLNSPNTRMTFFQQMGPFYEDAVQLLMQMHNASPESGFDREAFEFSEKARARVLLDNLPELRDVISPRLAGRERELRAKIDAAEQAKNRRESDLLRSEYEILYNESGVTGPWLKAGKSAPLVTAANAGALLGDDRTALLEYKVCDESTFVWVLSKKGVQVRRLPGRAKMTELVNNVLRAQRIQTVDADAVYWKAAGEASAAVIGPIADLLDVDRVLLVADDVLERLPFDGLTWPGGGESTGTPLIARFEIVSIPSASSASAFRSIPHEDRRFSKELAVFADPVFDPSDERLKNRARAQAASREKEAVRVRLAVAGEGAELLRRRLPPSRLSVFTDFDANLTNLRAVGSGSYRVLEFATHADVDSAHPDASGIQLSAFDTEGKPQPGKLSILDIYQLRLTSDVVVLSACDSAAGPPVAGEGLISLSRAFLFAGARRVIATLWPVEDVPAEKVTAELYSRMLGSGLTPSTALRQTQLALWKSGMSPRKWAAFVSIGDWTE